MENKKTKFQGLASLLRKDKAFNNIYQNDPSAIIGTAKTKAEKDNKILSSQQNKFIARAFKKASYDNAQNELNNVTNIELMYRDADLMDGFPEIGSALDIIAEESTVVNADNKILNITSSSDRIRTVLEDLFINRLDLHVTLPMISRAMCKYGNNFQLLNIDDELGVIGWKQLPVYQIKRWELGVSNPHALSYNNTFGDFKDGKYPDAAFVWVGKNESAPYASWQVSHFRLLMDSIYLPYGVSWLHKARRHWRMLSTMEDMMLLYRLERSIERRVFKINVGTIDESDVEAYVNDIANNFKRAPIFDHETGQVDLRKNYLDVSHDYFIPVRNENASNPIETLSSAQNITSMDDIEYMQNKILSALRIPKSFLNFQDNQGKGQNLSIMDIRFNRTVNKVQQALLMELNKIAIIHLYMLGFTDDLNNFSLSLNNPSPQMEMLELENLEKRLRVAQSAVADPGNGIPLYSWNKAQKEILKLNDTQIVSLLSELRIENAIRVELEKTVDIIKKTGVFDAADRVYGEIGAKYSDEIPDENLGGDLGNSLGNNFGDSFDTDFDEDFDDMGEDIDTNIDDVGEDINDTTPMEVRKTNKTPINEYIQRINKRSDNNKTLIERTEVIDKSLMINEDIQKLINEMTKMSSQNDN